jgi:hypothetical protein
MKLAGESDRANRVFDDFRQFREGESDEQWFVRQAALVGCLTMVAAQALSTLYEDEEESLDQEAVAAFLDALGDAGVTL